MESGFEKGTLKSKPTLFNRKVKLKNPQGKIETILNRFALYQRNSHRQAVYGSSVKGGFVKRKPLTDNY